MSGRGVEGPAARSRDAARAGLYVHVPFCAARCAYCDFASGTFSAAAAGRWLAALEREAAARAPAAAGLRFSSVFVGGGTPSVLEPPAVRRLFRALRAGFALAPDAEITLEANPESVEDRRLAAWREAGVDRLSLGAQSFHADELARLGRLHGPERPAAALARARAHGFRRLSLDLMYGFPGHTLERWGASLTRALELEPEHLSAYAFTAEAGTPLGDAVRAGAAPLPGDEEQAEARHNLVYWLRRPYVGLGPSAHGLLGGERYGNLRDLDAWAAALELGRPPEAEREPRSRTAAAREVLLLGLRLTSGVWQRDHEPALWTAVTERYGTALAEAVATGRLCAVPGGYAIPRALRYLADDVLAWIEARAEAHGFDSASAHSVPSTPCPVPPSSATGAAPTRT